MLKMGELRARFLLDSPVPNTALENACKHKAYQSAHGFLKKFAEACSMEIDTAHCYYATINEVVDHHNAITFTIASITRYDRNGPGLHARAAHHSRKAPETRRRCQRLLIKRKYLWRKRTDNVLR